MKKSISIIIPLFNNQNIIKNLFQKLDSIKTNNIEIIFVDDGSNDKTVSILKKCIKNKKDFYLFKNLKNQGPGIARNIGIRKSTSKNLLFLDSDDTINKKKFTSLDKFIAKKKFNICIFNNHIKKFYVSDQNTWIKNFFLKSFRREIIFGIYNKNFLINNKIFFKKGFYEDLVFLFQVILKNKKKIIFFDKKVYVKNDKNKKSITKQVSEKHIIDKINAWKNTFLIAKKYNNTLSNELLNFRMRGELVLLYKKIKNIKNKVLFNKFRRILLSHAKKYVNKSSINKSKIDLKFEKYFINEKI